MVALFCCHTGILGCLHHDLISHLAHQAMSFSTSIERQAELISDSYLGDRGNQTSVDSKPGRVKPMTLHQVFGIMRIGQRLVGSVSKQMWLSGISGHNDGG